VPVSARWCAASRAALAPSHTGLGDLGADGFGGRRFDHRAEVGGGLEGIAQAVLLHGVLASAPPCTLALPPAAQRRVPW
jgi:hypothetical protein